MSAKVIQLHREPQVDPANSSDGATTNGNDSRFEFYVQGQTLSLNFDEAYELALELTRMIQHYE